MFVDIGFYNLKSSIYSNIVRAHSFEYDDGKAILRSKCHRVIRNTKFIKEHLIADSDQSFDNRCKQCESVIARQQRECAR